MRKLSDDQVSRLAPEVPAEIDFACPDCGRGCKTFPKTRAVVHALPTCRAWDAIKSDRDRISMFVIRGGVELAFSRPSAS